MYIGVRKVRRSSRHRVFNNPPTAATTTTMISYSAASAAAVHAHLLSVFRQTNGLRAAAGFGIAVKSRLAGALSITRARTRTHTYIYKQPLDGRSDHGGMTTATTLSTTTTTTTVPE
jgi:hypothetical protein